MRIKLLVALAASALLFPGCAAKGYDRAEKAATSIEDVRDELLSAREQVDTTLQSLTAMAHSGNGDLLKAYKEYVSQLGKLDSKAKSSKSRAESMNVRSAEYFAAWRDKLQEIKSADIRQAGLERQEEAKKRYNRVLSAIEDTSKAYRPLMSELQDIKTYLESDLNPAGVKTITPMIREANTNAAALKQRIDVLVSEMGYTAGKLSSRGRMAQ